jgi:hypothetical protein
MSSSTQIGIVIEPLADVERRHILEAVRVLGMTEAGRALGIGKTTLYRKLHEYRGQTPVTSSEPRIPVVTLEELKPLLVSAKASADYLLRCVGTAHKLGEALQRELALFCGAR